MQLLNMMARIMGTVHRIMTVVVKQHKVGDPIVRAVPILMMDFDPITRGTGQVTQPHLPPCMCRSWGTHNILLHIPGCKQHTAPDDQ
jgi:hypothetical protein